MPTKAIKQRLLGVCTTVGGLLGVTFTFNHQGFDTFPEGLTYVFPGVICFCLLCLGVGLLWPTCRQKQDSAQLLPAEKVDQDTARFWYIAGLTCSYLVIIPITGFILSTLFFQATLLFLVFKKRGALWLCAVPTIATATLTLFFSKALSVPLPRGINIFYTFNSAII